MQDVLKNVQSTMSNVDTAFSRINTTGFDAVVAASSSATSAVTETAGAATSASSAFSDQEAQTARLSQALQDAARAASEANDNIGDLGSATSDAADDTEDLSNESEDAEKKVKKLGDQADKNEGIFKKMGGAVADAAGKVAKIGGVIAGVAGLGGVGVILTKGLDRLTAIDDAKAKLQGLGHSAEGVQTIMDNAMASVKGTAFGLGEAASTAAASVAAGVKPGKDLERTLKLVGDAATIAGTDINSMGGIFNKIAATNKVSGREMAQLSSAGIPALSLLGKAMGKTSEEVNKLVSEGKVDFETFQKAIEQGMGGAAMAGDTFSAATANMGASLGRLGAAILDAPFKAAPSLIGKMTASVDDVTNKVKALQAVLIEGDFNAKFTEAFGVEEDSKLVDYLFRVRDGFIGIKEFLVTGNIGEEMARAFDFNMPLLGNLEMGRDMVIDWGAQIGRIFSGLKDLAVELFGPLKEIGGSLSEASAAIGISVWTILLDILEALVPLLADTLVPVLQTVADLMNDNQWAVTGLVGAYTAWKIATAAATGYELASNAVLKGKAAIMPALTVMQKAYNVALKDNPIGIIITLLAALVGGLVIFFTKTETGKKVFERLKEIVLDVWEKIKEAFDKAWGFIQPIFESISSWVTETLIPAFTGLWEDGIKPAFDKIAEIFTWIWENVISKYFGLWETIIGEVIIPLVMFLWNEAIKPAFEGIGSIISGVWENVIQPVFGFFETVIGGIIIPIVMFLWNEAIKPAFEGIGNVIKTVWDTIISGIFDLLKKGMEKLGDVGKWLWEKALKPAWDGIGNAISAVYDNVIKPAFDLFKLGMEKLGDLGKWLWEEAIKPAWEGIGNVIDSIWQNVIEPAWEGMKTGLGAVGDFFTSTVEGIGRVWDTLHNILAKPINFLIGTVYNDGIAKAWNKVAEFIPGLITAPQLDKIPERATGGALYGPGTGTSDDILMWGSNGEHMVTAKEVRNAGGQSIVYAIRDMLARGIPFEWDNGRVISKLGKGNLSRYGSRVQEAGIGNASPEGLFDRLMPRFKDGGAIEPWHLQLQKGHEFAKSQHGKPYQWAGPTGPGSSFDCSGFMGSIAAVMTGNDPWRRYWATGSFGRGQGAGGPQGFVPGVDAGFSIGVTDDPGGPGGGHTAGTLGAAMGYTPVNVESGGALGNVHYGGGPSPMDFMGQYHLPIGANGFFQGGSGSGPTPEQQRGWLAEKVKDVLDGILLPIKQGIGSAIGTPPPEYLGIPPQFLDNGTELAADAVDGVIGGLGDALSSVWAGAQSKVSDVLSFLNPFDSGGVANGKGFLPKNVIEPERVLSPGQTRMFEILVKALDRITAGSGLAAPTLPSKIPTMSDAAAASFDEQGKLLSDTKAILERTESSSAAAADKRHAAVMKLFGEISDQLTTKALEPAFQAGLQAAMSSTDMDDVTKGMAQTMGQISGQLVGAAIQAATSGSGGIFGLPAFDSGGLANGMGYMPKATIAPERVLSPRQTSAFEEALSRNFGPSKASVGLGAELFGSKTGIGMFATNTIVTALNKVIGVEIKQVDLLQSVSKDVKSFRGDLFTAFNEQGQLLSDTASLLDRTASSKETAKEIRDKAVSDMIRGTLKFLVTSVLIPAVSAVLAGLITAATTAIGTAIAGPVGALVGAAVGAALGGLSTMLVGAIGSVLGSGIDAVFDSGGIANGMGMMQKATIEPERVLSPGQTRSFDRLVDILDKKDLGRTTVHAPFTVKGDARGGEIVNSRLLSLLNS